MLVAVLTAPLQSFASVYGNAAMAGMAVTGSTLSDSAQQSCQSRDEMQLHKSMDHCKQDMQCSPDCDHCAHCQWFPTAPLALHKILGNHVERASNIAFISHIPQTDLRPPRHT